MVEEPWGNVGLAELLGALSLGIDLGFGQPMEHVLRQCYIALRLAEALGLSGEEQSNVYYTALLVNVGCHTDAHEQARWLGDDIKIKLDKYAYGLHGARSSFAGLRHIGSGQPLLQRFRIGLNFALTGHRDFNGMVERHAAMAGILAGEIGLPAQVQEAVGASYEQWDGKGWPGDLSGEGVPIAARISQLAEFVEVAHRSGGIDAAVALARELGGSQFDPAVANAFAAAAHDVLPAVDTTSTWDDVIGAEPALTRALPPDDLDVALGAIADFIDLKTPYMLGHARGLLQIVDDAAAQLGLNDAALTTLRRAALASGFGRLGVSNAIWDKPGPLGAGERERVRLHPYLTERMFQQSPGLARVGALAAQVRERLDGSGYPRGTAGEALTRPARVLAAADVYQSMVEPRPHRPARSPNDAAKALRAEARAGRLDGDVVEAVLVAAGHRGRVRREQPGGLTLREVEVLRLLALGLSSKDIASELVISTKTARNHIEHIYVKTGATNRVAASHYAIKHGLVGAVAG